MELAAIRCAGDRPPCELSGLSALVGDLIESLRIGEAIVDGFSDCRDLPATTAAALAELQRIATVEHDRRAARSRWYWWWRRQPTCMAVRLDLTVPEERRVFVESRPWSIHAETLAPDDDAAWIELHDSGSAITISAEASDADTARRILREHRATWDGSPA